MLRKKIKVLTCSCLVAMLCFSCMSVTMAKSSIESNTSIIIPIERPPIDALMVVKIKKHLLGLVQLSPSEIALYDMDNDGDVDVFDLVEIIRIILAG